MSPSVKQCHRGAPRRRGADKRTASPTTQSARSKDPPELPRRVFSTHFARFALDQSAEPGVFDIDSTEQSLSTFILALLFLKYSS